MSSQSIKIALAQMCPINAPEGGASEGSNRFSNLEQNLLKARNWVEEASESGADVAVLPEYFLQGLVDNGRQHLTYPSKYLAEFITRLAAEHRISIVGTIVHAQFPAGTNLPTQSPFSHIPLRKGDGGPAESMMSAEWESFCQVNPSQSHAPPLANTAFFADGDTGKMAHEYIKRNLWHPERDYLTRGDSDHQVFETKWGKCGFMICWDASHPGAGQALSDLGADIVFAPTYWLGYDSSPVIEKHHDDPPSYETEILTALSCARAFETETAWVMCNAGGPAEERFIGGSGVWMPLKGRLAGLDGSEGMKVVTVDLGVLRHYTKYARIKKQAEVNNNDECIS